MSSGTRSLVAAAQCADPAGRIAECEAALLKLSGRANQSEQNRINRELWALHQQHGSHSRGSKLQSTGNAHSTTQQATDAHVNMRAQQILSHWRVLRPDDLNPHTLSLCVRCGDGTAATCRFHPDAKAYAFGCGRFDYGYTSLWDTPHDRWFCCGRADATAEGCVEECCHTTDSEWWWALSHLSPALPEDDGCASDSEGEEGDSASMDDEEVASDQDPVAAMAAMEIS